MQTLLRWFMSTKARNEESMNILEAIETLSTIVDFEDETGYTPEETPELIGLKRRIEWLVSGDPSVAMTKVKEIFHVIFNYLRAYYQKKIVDTSNQKTVEGIKNIMVLVGEAAKKLDRHKGGVHSQWEGSITQWREFKQLQEFYRDRIDKRIDQKVLSKWLLGLAGGSLLTQKKERFIEKKGVSTSHLYVDLDTVRKDSEYELMLMTKEDGNRFFSPRLLRNIKLVCDFGGTLQNIETRDPLAEVGLWYDRICHTSAKTILQSLGTLVDRYFRDVARYKDMDLVCDVSKALMSLYCCANPENLLFNKRFKSCRDYFADFQMYLRYAMSSREYQKFLAYPPKKSNKVANCMLQLIQGICRSIFLELPGILELKVVVDQLLESSHVGNIAAEEENLIYSAVAADYASLSNLMKFHPNGPLLKILDHLEVEHYRGFDSLVQGNLPHVWYQLNLGENIKSLLLRLPSPTHQIGVQKAGVGDEFKGFLFTCNTEKPAHHLLINLQDRTSWREHARSAALEQLQNGDCFKKSISVITIAEDTEFYHQLQPYDGIQEASVFMDLLKEHICDANAGYYFPENILPKIAGFIEDCIKNIHEFFFNGEVNLNREQRQEFISITHLFLQLKLIDIIQPDTFSLTCKDGVDISEASICLLTCLIEFINHEKLSNDIRVFLNLILHGPALVIRERIMLPEIFNRMIRVLQVIENTRGKLGFEDFRRQFFARFTPLFHFNFDQVTLNLK